MQLTCYQVDTQPVEIVPGAPDRDWMDAFESRHPYRCLPLVIANTTGWALLSPVSFRATWNGGPHQHDIKLEPADDTPAALLSRWASSHFSGGVITFHTGYLFRTEPGWDLWVGGPPNVIKDGVTPLTGVVETFWLPFPFTMNWRFTRPGTIHFRRGEPFCFVMPIPHAEYDATEPVIRSIHDDPELKAQYENWGASRADFLNRLSAREAGAIDAGWQRDYLRGRTPAGEAGPAEHIHRRRLKPPRRAP